MAISSQPLSGEQKTQVCVVGSGIAGISCAYHCEKEGFQTIVLEENTVASGATNYSSGVLYFGSGTAFSQAIELFGKEKAKALWDESKQAIDDIVSISKEIPSTGLRETGLTLVARNEQERNDLLAEEAAMQQLGYPGKSVSSQELSTWFTTAKFVSGLLQNFCYQIKPPFLAKELAEKLNSTVYENSAMTEIVESSDGVVVKTANGSILCEQVVVATNIKPFYGLEEHFFMEDSVDLPSQQFDEQAILKMWPRDTIFSTFDEKYDLFYRHDNKIFFEAYTMKGIEQKSRQYFPVETGVVFDKGKAYGDSWAKTRDWLPIVGKVPGKERVNCAIAMGDQGIVMGWASGRNIARLLKGEKSAFLEMCAPDRLTKVISSQQVS